VAAWLLGIVVNLLMVPAFFDVALRDFGLCFDALAPWTPSQRLEAICLLFL